MYRRKKWFAEQYGISIRTVNRKIDWIKQHESRYPANSLVRNGGMTFVREDVFEDVIVNEDRINAGLNPSINLKEER